MAMRGAFSLSAREIKRRSLILAQDLKEDYLIEMLRGERMKTLSRYELNKMRRQLRGVAMGSTMTVKEFNDIKSAWDAADDATNDYHRATLFKKGARVIENGGLNRGFPPAAPPKYWD